MRLCSNVRGAVLDPGIRAGAGDRGYPHARCQGANCRIPLNIIGEKKRGGKKGKEGEEESCM